MAIDQAHEQNNAEIKGDGGAIGLTEDPAALRRWMVAGQEVSRLLAACEAMSSSIDTRIDRRHHEATVGAQTALFENVKVMTTVLQDMGNPFQNESSDLLSLDTKNIANPSLAQLVAIHHHRGLKQVEVFLGGLHKEEGMSEITANRDSSSTSEYAIERAPEEEVIIGRRLSYGEYDTSQILEDVRGLCPRIHSSQDKVLWRNIQKS